MRKDTFYIEEIKKEFETKKKISVSDIERFYETKGEKLSRSLLDWRINYLVNIGLLKRTSRGIYTLGEALYYIPVISSGHKYLYKNIKAKYPLLDICIWNTNLVNEFSRHQTGKHFTIIETEKDGTEGIFNFISDDKRIVFLNPNKEIMSNYVYERTNTFIVKNIISEAPLIQYDNVSGPHLEKILVDLYCDKNTFFVYQGIELEYIYKAAFSKYTINESRLIRYADRRKRKEQILNLVSDVTKN